MWKYLKFILSGGMPSIVRYEQKQAALRALFAKHEALMQLPSVKKYHELAAQIATPRRQSGVSKAEYKKLKIELAAFRKDSSVISFFSLQKKTHNFRDLILSDEFFYEDFTTPELDPQKWIVRRPCADTNMPEIQYSSSDDFHLFTTDGQNIELTDGSMRIITKKEPCEGLVFSHEFGFIPAKRDFTSGIINTGYGCRLLYGAVEVKFKYRSASKHAYHTIWMSGGKRLPHINIVRIGKKVEMGTFAQSLDGSIVQHSSVWRKGLLKPDTYYVVRMRWDKDRIEWRINGKKMFSAPCNIHEPMFLGLSSGVADQQPHSRKESALEIKIVKMSMTTT
jgi:hypothetical protein